MKQISLFLVLVSGTAISGTVTAQDDVAVQDDTPVHGHDKQGPQEFWRDRRQCGVNCVYLLLRVAGAPVDYVDLLEKTAIGAKGSTLAELREGAAAVGHDLEIVKGGPAELATAKLPIIVHMDAFYSDQSRAGHYVVLTEFNKRGVRGFDGVTANFFELPIDRFYKCWSGYVLRLPRQAVWLRYAGMALCLVLVLIGLIKQVRRRHTPLAVEVAT